MEIQTQIIRAVGGEKEARDALAAYCLPIVYRYLRKAWRVSTEEAEELTQEIFSDLWPVLSGFRGGSFKAWILTIARRVTWKSYQSHPTKSRATNTDDSEDLLQLTDEAPSPEALLSSKEQVSLLRQVFETLKPDAREILYLRYLEELSLEEISQMLEVSYEVAKSRLKRARKVLKELWQSHFVDCG
ncbi:sigma-70 family RNA polymerase sigma factor [Myxococcota bacterium]|nr:sigma-70 family RNA polymerase sigma factor [Myxococcota bacterium]